MSVTIEASEGTGITDPRRRAVLSRAVSALVLATVGSVGLGNGRAVASAFAKRQSGRLLTITYPGGPLIRFDASYYRDHHAKLFMDIYGAAIERFELRTIAGGAFSALINIWIADFELFHARSTEAAYQRMGDDKKNFTNTSSAVQVDQVRFETGEPRSGIPLNTGCVSLLYPSGQAGGWNDNERCRAYVEGVKGLLGPEALRRIELRQGIEQLDDGSPAYQGGVNLYVRNSAAFSQAWQRHRAAIEGLSTQLCSVVPVELNTTVVGIDTTQPKA